jgi:hypothetical protein
MSEEDACEVSKEGDNHLGDIVHDFIEWHDYHSGDFFFAKHWTDNDMIIYIKDEKGAVTTFEYTVESRPAYFVRKVSGQLKSNDTPEFGKPTHKYGQHSIITDETLNPECRTDRWCPRCDSPLNPIGDSLVCSSCGYKENFDDEITCDNCGSQVVRNGSMIKCFNCGNSIGCS